MAHGQSQDEIFLAAQEALDAHCDSQARIFQQNTAASTNSSRKRLKVFTYSQLKGLENTFVKNPLPPRLETFKVCEELKLDERVVPD